MPTEATESSGVRGGEQNSVARFNGPGRQPPPRAGENGSGDNAGAIKPRLARTGYTRFLTLANLDGRSRAVANCNALKAGFETDLGGAETLTTGQAQLVQRAAMLSVVCEDFETRHLLGQPIEIDQYLTAINVQRRVLVTIGLERRARDVSRPSLSEYLRGRATADDEVVVGVANGSAEPVVDAGLELAPEGVSSGAGQPHGATEAPAGRVPAPSPESRTGGETEQWREASGEPSSPAADRPGGNGAAP
jgi:hypothetical protein